MFHYYDIQLIKDSIFFTLDLSLYHQQSEIPMDDTFHEALLINYVFNMDNNAYLIKLPDSSKPENI